ncbi:MAG TPA: type II CAAX endopeptidase family protein [Oligoflexus sp.]|uniref:CPBP family intramembrane glutamic endopeptidase n=1 Tax=Oligoflexus sp. TaxID=1971216 RepID=UPI002D666F47|nr:type II CAAX endopeptidase family protein [Oligoflexus sp.]HYX34641.1 type II CAAX endopeptidase family protein [Oligoflexus sp.]
MSLSLSMRAIYFTLLMLLGWALSIFYAWLSRQLPPGWLTIALVHSGLALLIWRFGAGLRLTPRWGMLAFLPAAVILVGSVGASLLSRGLIAGAPPMDGSWDGRLLAFVVWIPIVEELVFRLGIGGLARHKLGDYWGAYASALVFALAHGSGVWNELSTPIGPLILGLCCEWLYVASGRLTAAMALHAACNASGWIFAALDERWLSWLQALYLKV